MSLTLNKTKVLRTMLPALAIMVGVMLKNGGEQFAACGGRINKKQMKMIGSLLFVGGWIGIAYAVGMACNSMKRGKHMWMPVAASAGVLLSVMAMMHYKHKKDKPRWLVAAPVIFAGSWLLLGYSVAMGKGNLAMMFGLGAAACVLLSMMVALPWQRKKKVIDGPGMALFALGWIALTVANSM
jgi:uncharacterized membrane protein YhdT